MECQIVSTSLICGEEAKSSSDATDRSGALSIQAPADRPSESILTSEKVSRLSDLQLFILVNAANGLERGDIAELYYNLPRRYKRHYTDPCPTVKEGVDYNRRFRRAQSAITKSLMRLRNRGLVRLIRRHRYVKRIFLTPQGKQIVRELKQTNK